jgi:ABC-type polysaccharide/polyol phosphate export permease
VICIKPLFTLFPISKDESKSVISIPFCVVLTFIFCVAGTPACSAVISLFDGLPPAVDVKSVS